MMTNKQRREAQMAYITDKTLLEEQQICRKKLQKLNFIDRSDFDGIAEIVKDLFGKSEKQKTQSHIHISEPTRPY